MSPSHIDHAREPFKIAGLQHVFGLTPRATRHGIIKGGSGLWMAPIVLPRVHAVGVSKGMFTRAHAVKKVPPRLPVFGLTDEDRPLSDRFRRVGPQAVAERDQREASVWAFPENTNARERPEHPVQ